MRRLLALLCVLLLSAAAPARDGVHMVAEDQAGWAFGRPGAPLLAEYASFGCPQCAHFSVEAGPALVEHVREGRLRLAFRPFLIFPHDRAAAVLACCVAPGRWHGFIAALMAAQPQTRARLRAAQADDLTRQRLFEADLAGPERHAAVIADLSGLQQLAADHGLAEASADKCLADPANHAWVTAADLAARVEGVTGTPTYTLGGRRLPHDLTPAQWFAHLPRATSIRPKQTRQ